MVEKELIYYIKQLNVYAGINVLLPRYFRTLPPTLYKIWEGYAFLLELFIICFKVALVMPMILTLDLEITLNSLGGLSLIISAISKGFIFHWYNRKYTKIVEDIEMVYNRNANNPFKDDTFDEFYEKEYAWVVTWTKRLWLSQAPAPIVWGFVHAVSSIFEPDNTKWLHPIIVWTPFEHENQSLLRYHMEVWFTAIGSFAFNVRTITYDALFSATLVLMVAQVKYLRYLSENVLPPDGQPNDPEIQERLDWWCKQHSDICRILNDFRSITTPYMIVMYSLVLYNIFNVAIVVTILASWDPFQKILISSMVVIQLIQLYVVCMIGDALSEEGTFIADDCWINTVLIQSTSVKKNFLLMLERTKKVLSITTCGLYPLSSETFGALLSTTFSMYITIMQVRNKRTEQAMTELDVQHEDDDLLLNYNVTDQIQPWQFHKYFSI